VAVQLAQRDSEEQLSWLQESSLIRCSRAGYLVIVEQYLTRVVSGYSGLLLVDYSHESASDFASLGCSTGH
jgi:hypothetical protein